MAGLTMRDRFFTPRVARAIMSPLGIVLFLAVTILGLVAGLPVVAAVALGVVAWGGRIALATGPGPRAPRIDPFTVNEPWRSFVQDALSARGRFHEAVERTRSGPLHETLHEIASRLDTGVQESWAIAQRGEALVRSRREIDTATIDRELAEAHQAAADNPDDPVWSATLKALQTQRSAADRLDAVIAGARNELRLLDARLGEAVVRAIELSAHASTADSALGLSSDVDGMVTDLEALHQALEETHGVVGPGGGRRGGAAGDDPARGLGPGPAPG